jgi:hypothetical protein
MRHVQSPQRNRNYLRYALLCLFLASSSGVRAATPGDQAGVFADGSIRSLFLICSTCTPASETDDQQHAGGFGNNGPAIVGGFDQRGTGTASYDARAIILGPNVLPELKADASAAPGIGTHPGFSGTGAYFFTSSADTNARQYYTYHGLTPETYTISYVLKGQALGATPEDEPLITVSGGVTLFDDGDKLGGELPMGHVVDSSQKSFSGSAHSFLDGGTVSITVDPGHSFYLSAFLSAGVAAQADGIADAGHTFTTSFTAGDTSLLTGLLPTSPVPEPSTYGMLALGLSLVAAAVLLRRRDPLIATETA